MSRAAGGYLHHLAAQGLHQWGVFALGVDDDDIVLCAQHDLGNLQLDSQRLARPGLSQYHTGRGGQVLAAEHQQGLAASI